MKYPFIRTLDINSTTPAEGLPLVPLPPAVTGAKKYECDACKVQFTVHWGKHRETCPCCDMFCDQAKE
jgi:hypothetical protein